MCYFCANSLANFDPWMLVAAPQMDIVYHPVEVMNAYCHDADQKTHWDVQICSEPACATFQVLPHNKGSHAFTIRGCADYILKRSELYQTDRAQSKCYQLPNSTVFNASFTLCTCPSQLCNGEATFPPSKIHEGTAIGSPPTSSSSNPQEFHEIDENEGSGENEENKEILREEKNEETLRDKNEKNEETLRDAPIFSNEANKTMFVSFCVLFFIYVLFF